jgi:hypothetical protein
MNKLTLFSHSVNGRTFLTSRGDDIVGQIADGIQKNVNKLIAEGYQHSEIMALLHYAISNAEIFHTLNFEKIKLNQVPLTTP